MIVSYHLVCRFSKTRPLPRPRLWGNSPQTILLTTIAFFVLSIEAFAHLGDTMEQAKEQLGHPSGEVKSGTRTILIYQTPRGKVTETYNAQGICVESDADKLFPRTVSAPDPNSVTKSQPKPAIAIAPAPSQDVRHSSPEEQAVRPPGATASTAAPHAPWKNKLSPTLIVIALVSIAVGIIAWWRRKADPKDHSALAVNEIKALCELEQGKHEHKPIHQSQQNSAYKYNKDNPST